MLFSYFAPEVMLPVASIIATVVGGLMMFGRYLWYFARNTFLRMMGKAPAAPKPAMARRSAAHLRQDTGHSPAATPHTAHASEAVDAFDALSEVAE